jgi:glutaconyl-CoA/methylmalonyl-CoA decarboxylase subunit gamma
MAKVTIGARSYEVEVKGDTVVVDGREYAVTVKDDGAYQTVKAGDISYRVQLPPADQRQGGMNVSVDYRPFTVNFEGRFGSGPAPVTRAPAAAASAPRAGVKGGVAAQIAGKVLKLRVKAGDVVKQGDVLLLLEAMKMENEIKAPADGTVQEVTVAEGQRVTEGETLIVLA